MQSHEHRLHSAFSFAPAFRGTSRAVKQRQNHLFNNHSSFGFQQSAASPDNLEVTLPCEEVMRATRKDTGNRHPRTSQSAVVPAIPEQWYECLNETGPKPGSIPFVDGKPNFSSEVLYAQIFQMIRLSVFRTLCQTTAVHSPCKLNGCLPVLPKVRNQHLCRIPCCLG